MSSELDSDVRTVAAQLMAKGFKVSMDFCVGNDGAAAVIRRSPKTVQNWRYRACGPPWHKLRDGTVWYRISDLLTWKKAGARENSGSSG